MLRGAGLARSPFHYVLRLAYAYLPRVVLSRGHVYLHAGGPVTLNGVHYSIEDYPWRVGARRLRGATARSSAPSPSRLIRTRARRQTTCSWRLLNLGVGVVDVRRLGYATARSWPLDDAAPDYQELTCVRTIFECGLILHCRYSLGQH